MPRIGAIGSPCSAQDLTRGRIGNGKVDNTMNSRVWPTTYICCAYDARVRTHRSALNNFGEARVGSSRGTYRTAQIGRASIRERVSQSGKISVVTDSIQKKNTTHDTS